MTSLAMRYRGQSELVEDRGSQIVSLAPNLARDAVALDAPLLHPLAFREAISSLHDVVTTGLRGVKRDRPPYQAWKQSEAARETAIQPEALSPLVRQGNTELLSAYKSQRKRYWELRDAFSQHLVKNDPRFWRSLMPLDPMITVASDVVFFECFSADQSTYGCLTLKREEMFGPTLEAQQGTTTVDYSWNLYDQMQSLRTYRDTRLLVDPEGREVAVGDQPVCREETVALPQGWLRGFFQLQAAMTLPMAKVSLSRDALYSILAWLKRHKPPRSPRALRLELIPGLPPTVVMEPWEQPIVSHTTRYEGSKNETFRLWEARRLLSLSRLLPLVESCEVYVLGTGLPSFWVAKMGGMQMTLGLSGWTDSNWSGSAALELLSPPGEPSPARVEACRRVLAKRQAIGGPAFLAEALTNAADGAAMLHYLARTGQVIYDLAAKVYRWRQVMPGELGAHALDPPSPELPFSLQLVRRSDVLLESEEEVRAGEHLYRATIENKQVELVLDRDGNLRRGKCGCSYQVRHGVRRGPCRHLLALRAVAMGMGTDNDTSNAAWYNRVSRWGEN